MFATAASVTAGSLAALTAMARSETVQSAQREAAAELRGVVATTGEVATDRAMLHGFCTMSDIVTLNRPLPVEVSVTAAARAAGGVAAMLLPQVHQDPCPGAQRRPPRPDGLDPDLQPAGEQE